VPEVTPDPAATVTVVARDEDGLTLHYASPTANLLRVAIPAYPGWHASLDDRDLALVTVDAAFTGVLVPAGEGDVQLAYTPRLFVAGALVSAIALLAAVLVYVKPRN
jgi:uncharacterized membrane protein YfhO